MQGAGGREIELLEGGSREWCDKGREERIMGVEKTGVCGLCRGVGESRQGVGGS